MEHEQSSKSSSNNNSNNNNRGNNNRNNSSRGRISTGRGNFHRDIEVPILYWNQAAVNSNYNIWKEKLISYASKRYQYITHILENNEEYPI